MTPNYWFGANAGHRGHREEDGLMTRIVHRRPRALAMSLGVLMLAIASAHAGGAGRDPFEVLGVLRPAEPLAAPDVAFRALDGRAARLGELRGKVVLLGFFTTW